MVHWESSLTSGTFPSKGASIKSIFLFITYQVWVEIPVIDSGNFMFLSFGPMNYCQISDSFPFSYLHVLTELAIASFTAWHSSEGSYTALTLFLWWFSKRLASLWEPLVGNGSGYLCHWLYVPEKGLWYCICKWRWVTQIIRCLFQTISSPFLLMWQSVVLIRRSQLTTSTPSISNRNWQLGFISACTGLEIHADSNKAGKV